MPGCSLGHDLPYNYTERALLSRKGAKAPRRKQMQKAVIRLTRRFTTVTTYLIIHHSMGSQSGVPREARVAIITKQVTPAKVSKTGLCAVSETSSVWHYFQSAPPEPCEGSLGGLWLRDTKAQKYAGLRINVWCPAFNSVLCAFA